jgi:4-hydroxy-tetrahydrodipicolinate synthase
MQGEQLRGVFAVPPLARAADDRRALDWSANDRIVRHIVDGGVTRLLYGGNAFLYHVTLGEYEDLLGWLAALPDEVWPIPSLGPSFGRAMDQAVILRRHRVRCVMALPSGDPRDARGLERGYREIAEAAGMPLVLYLKEEENMGADREAGLDMVARLVEAGVCVGIKYAVVRRDPREDPYLEGLVRRVDRQRIISGIGERPAVVHMLDWQLPGFTTGSGCLAPRLSQGIFDACVRHDRTEAERLRRLFLPVEDLRDELGAARVLHAATELAGIAATGSIPPFVSPLDAGQRARIEPAARELLASELAVRTTAEKGDSHLFPQHS